jgi:hypothetical protein
MVSPRRQQQFKGQGNPSNISTHPFYSSLFCSELGLVQVNLDENVIGSSFGGIQSRSSSGDKPLADMSPCSEEHIEMGGARAPIFHRQSAPSSTGSSSKRRHYLVMNNDLG